MYRFNNSVTKHKKNYSYNCDFYELTQECIPPIAGIELVYNNHTFWCLFSEVFELTQHNCHLFLRLYLSVEHHGILP